MTFHSTVDRRTLLASAGAATLTSLVGCGGASAQSAAAITQKSVSVSDGVRLNYLEAGAGARTLVMLPGWSQTAEQFKLQLESLGNYYRVIAIDMRGHGDSDKPVFGYRIQRLAKDLEDVLSALNLTGVNLLAHSMGNSVAWCHMDMFGSARIAKYICCDEPASLVVNPLWTPQQIENAGAIFSDANQALSTANAIAADAGVSSAPTSEGFLRSMVTKNIPAETFAWIKAQNLKMPRAQAADLLYNHCFQDWRDVIPRINVPTLFIGGKVSNVPYKSVQWQQTQVPNSQIRIFEENEGGSHFMFIENPSGFNALIANFIG